MIRGNDAAGFHLSKNNAEAKGLRLSASSVQIIVERVE
jgi:hypothetical protein